MSNLIEALLTVAANIGGYALAFLLVVHSIRRAGSVVVGFPSASVALFVLWVVTLAWYIGTVFWIDANYGPHNVPPWLESTSGVAENIQSEVVQIWLASLVFKYLPWQGSPESK